MNSEPSLPLEIDCRSVQQKMNAGEDFLLLDCREADEYATAKITPSQFMPMSEISERLHELEPHRQRQVVVYCHHGGRSMRVARWLRGQGFLQVQSLAGGIDQWSQEIDPGVPRY
ncbi:MAG TPA: rhodanese-like domain-containing protein [Pirellulales bacterium]|jgi:rhodanese-related sulfurtransferase|nr:rhodanese-like domain-containing protein [Pirellulales bacterium]